jgi:glycopeptide antibiotics resistance protein
VASLHEKIIGINDDGQYYMTDKQLHFWVIGLFGMALILVIQPIFKGLAENGFTLVITWIYVFTVVIVITFAIEIGQWYTGSGVMESEDVAYGVTGFLVLFFIYAIVRGTILTVWRMIRRSDEQGSDYERQG